MQITSKSVAPSGLSRRWPLLLIALVVGVVWLTGCPGFLGSKPPMSAAQRKDLADRMIAIEQIKDPKALDALARQYKTEMDGSDSKEIKARDTLLRAYAAEYAETVLQSTPDYTEARSRYESVQKTGGDLAYTNLAYYRLGVLGARGKLDGPEASMKAAKNDFRRLSNDRNPILVRLRPQDGQWQITLAGEGGPATYLPNDARPAGSAAAAVIFPREGAAAVRMELDHLYRIGGGLDQSYYIAVDSIVNVFNRISPGYGMVLALIFLALFVKLITMPLTNASMRGMRDMQKMQPLIKELQEKYRDDQAKLAEAQMALYKEHNVSPMGGCLPMLIQLPVFIIVYQAVLVYSAGFANAHFLWISSLAEPNQILLILYAVSMVVTQLLTSTPTTDPQQKMIQQQMTVMMPLMLMIFLSTMASAFILYWLFLNIFSSAHQYYLKWKYKQEDVAAALMAPVASTAPASTPRKKGKHV